MKPDKQFIGDGKQVGFDLYADHPAIGERIVQQLPEHFSKREFMAVICQRGLAYDYGNELLIEMIKAGSVLCIEPDTFKSTLKPKGFNRQ